MKNITLSLLLVCLSLLTMAQDNQAEKNYLWKGGVHFGSSMLWGDLAQDADPFTKMFSKQSKLSFELDLHRKITNVFGIQGSFIYGKLAGQRTTWSDDQHAGIGFNTDYIDYSLAINADLTNLFFGVKPERLISVYVLGGAGMVHYDGSSYDLNTNAQYFSVKDKTLFIPWGWGLSFNLTPRFSIFTQNTFRHTFVDDIDSYIGSGTDVKDLYSFTSVGASYKFGPKKAKEEKIKIVPVEPDTIIAVADYIPVEVSTSINMPSSIKNNEEKTVNVVLNKGDLKGQAEYTQSFPDGFMVEPIDVSGGNFSYNIGKLSIKWDDISTSEQIKFSYQIKAGEITPQTYSIPGTFVYTEKDQVKVKQFKNQISVIREPAVAVVEEPVTNTNKTEPVKEEPVEVVQKQNTDGITYAVQIAAVYGGKMNPMSLQKQHNLNETVNESSYKGYNNYTVGNFKTYGEADARRKGTNVRGAYVVVFKDGVYQPHLYYVNKDIMDANPFLPTGTTYKVQVLANNGKPYSIAKIANKLEVEPSKIYEDKIGNWYQYTTGSFDSADKAKEHVDKLKAQGYEDAYIVKFVNGVRTR